MSNASSCCTDVLAEISSDLVSAQSCCISSRTDGYCRLCFVHNQVNERLGKPEFDCANLDATYDCGCGDEPIHGSSDPMDLELDLSKDRVTGVGMIKGGR